MNFFLFNRTVIKMPKAPKVKVTETVIHPRSRKAGQMIKNAHRKDKQDRRKSERTATLQTLAEKVRWFKDNMELTEITHYSIQEVHNLINLYFKRFDKELEQLRIGDSIKGRQQLGGTQFARENAIKMALEREKQVYDSTGLEIPDITTTANVKLLRVWNGNLDYLQKIKLKRFRPLKVIGAREDKNTNE